MIHVKLSFLFIYLFLIKLLRDTLENLSLSHIVVMYVYDVDTYAYGSLYQCRYCYLKLKLKIVK